jgi:hypothetical protein
MFRKADLLGFLENLSRKFKTVTDMMTIEGWGGQVGNLFCLNLIVWTEWKGKLITTKTLNMSRHFLLPLYDTKTSYICPLQIKFRYFIHEFWDKLHQKGHLW